MDYCDVAWSSFGKIERDRLDRAQRREAKIVLKIKDSDTEKNLKLPAIRRSFFRGSAKVWQRESPPPSEKEKRTPDRKLHEPWPPHQWLCPCTRALVQEPRVALCSWLPVDKS